MYKYVDGDIWNALYKNDILVFERHPILPHEYFSILSIENYHADLEWLDTMGRFPINFNQVKVIK